MKSNVVVASTLAALTAGGLVGEAIVSAESAETHCATPACTEHPAAVEPWSPDMPEHENAAHAPAVQLDQTNGPATTNSSPPFFGGIDNEMMSRRHRIPWRPRIQVDDEGWLYSATQDVRSGQTAIALRAIK
jgi:hypothetical protein